MKTIENLLATIKVVGECYLLLLSLTFWIFVIWYVVATNKTCNVVFSPFTRINVPYSQGMAKSTRMCC